jgi:hypothetical protein
MGHGQVGQIALALLAADVVAVAEQFVEPRNLYDQTGDEKVTS